MRKIIGMLMLMIMLMSSMALAQGHRPVDVPGLENVMATTETEQQHEAIEQAMNRLQERDRAQLQLLDNALVVKTPNGETVVTGVKDAEFLGLFRVRRQYQYEIEENGEMTRRRRMFDFLFTETL